MMVLAGRPYHIDPEICHGIDRLAASLGFVVVSEDSVCHLAPKENVHVLDQWTFHARLYRAARFAVEHPGRASWCSWCPSAAALTRSPPTRRARILERCGYASIHRSRSTKSPIWARCAFVCAVCWAHWRRRRQVMQDKTYVPFTEAMKQDPHHSGAQHAAECTSS